MSTPNYITVSLKNAELTTENGISIAGISKQFKSIRAICGFLMLTGIMIGGEIKSPITAPYKVSITYTEPEDEGEEPEEIVTVNIYNVHGYNIKILNDLAISTPIPDNFDLKEELKKCLKFYEIDCGSDNDFNIETCLSEDDLNYIIQNKIDCIILKTKTIEDDDTYYRLRTYFRFNFDEYNSEFYFYSLYTLYISVIFAFDNGDGYEYTVNEGLLVTGNEIEGMKKVYKHTFTLNGNTFDLISYKSESATKLSQLFNEKIISLFVHGSNPGYITKCSYSFSNWGNDIYVEIISRTFGGTVFSDNTLYLDNSSEEVISDTVTFIS